MTEQCGGGWPLGLQGREGDGIVMATVNDGAVWQWVAIRLQGLWLKMLWQGLDGRGLENVQGWVRLLR